MPRTTPHRKSKLHHVNAPTGLPADQCTIACDLSAFDFETTESIEVLEAVIEQDRAVQSLELGLSITRPNYHVYVAGPSGTGKRSQLKAMLGRIAPTRKTPLDWVYLHNFADTDTPFHLGLKAGDGKRLKKAMDKLLEQLQQELPAAFHSREHQERLQHAVSQGNMHSTDAFVALSRAAEQVGFLVRSNKNDELVTLPVVDGKTLSDKDVMALAEDERKKLDKKRELLEPLFTEFVQSNRLVEQDTQAKITGLQKGLAERVAKPLIRKVKDECRSGGKKLAAFLDALYEDLQSHMERFLPDDDKPQPRDGPGPDPFAGFHVNLIVDNEKTEGAPIVFETHPTYYRLFGKIERRVEQGIYFTDHTMIRSGSFARANGGYLICHAADLFQFPGVWENLKATLRNAEVTVEDLGETAGLLPTSGLKPEPIPLNVKLVLIGGNSLYHMLYRADDDFRKIFQVKADFDYEIRRNAESVRSYVRFIATASRNNGCRPVDKEGVAAIIEHGSRIVESQRKLTLRFNQLSNLLVESDYFAAKSRSKVIGRKHVDKAITARTLSSSLIADKMHDDLLDDQWLMESSGSEKGVINGLAVMSVGEHHFGRPFRVTARCFAGQAGIVNIEREVQMSGEIHDKGVQILSGFLGDRFAQKRPLCLTATVTFEQSYGEVDGDSASSTWLYAILSALAGIGINQGIGVTGSVNQLGQIQPIGGVNEKIEGFFRFCQARKMTGKQGVMIPWQNVQHLMLNREVRDAIAKGRFHIWPIRTIEEGLEVLTGVEAGKASRNGVYPEGTLMRAVADRLETLRKNVATQRGSSGKKGGPVHATVGARRKRQQEDDGGEGTGDWDDLDE